MGKHCKACSAGQLSGGRLRAFVGGNVSSAHCLTGSRTHMLPSTSHCCGKKDPSLGLLSTGFSSVHPSSGMTLTGTITRRTLNESSHVVSIDSSCDSKSGFKCQVADGNFRKRAGSD